MPLPTAAIAAKVASIAKGLAAATGTTGLEYSFRGYAVGGFSQQGVKGIMAATPQIKAGVYKFTGGMGGKIQGRKAAKDIAKSAAMSLAAQLGITTAQKRGKSKPSKSASSKSPKAKSSGKRRSSGGVKVAGYVRKDGVRVGGYVREQ